MASPEPESATPIQHGTYFDEKERFVIVSFISIVEDPLYTICLNRRPWTIKDYEGVQDCSYGCMRDVQYKYEADIQTKKLDFSHSNHSEKLGDPSGK